MSRSMSRNMAGGGAMTDIILMLVVVGTVVVALIIDLAAAVNWLRRQTGRGR